MHKIALSFVFALTFFSVFAQTNKATINSSTQDETVLSFQLDTYSFDSVLTERGSVKTIKAENLSAIMEKNAPDLLKFTESILIPDTDKMAVRVISSEFTEIENIEIAPSKGNFTRDIDPASIPYIYGKNYTEDRFYPGKLASLDTPYIVRDYRGQSVHVYPFQYNPISKTLRVYSTIKIKIYSESNKGVNQLNRTASLSTISSEYSQIYNKHFINYNAGTRYEAVEETGNMLIVCYDDWLSEMSEFVLWKNTIGRPTELVSVTDAGGSAENIKTFVQNYYNTNGLTYLLLVGDSDQIPTNSGGDLGGHSDNAYAYVTGDDHYQEFFVGRFSAEDATQVATQVERSIEYEKGDALANGWLNKAMSVGSNQGDGSGDDGEADWAHLRNIQTDLEGFTYIAPFFEHFDGSHGAPDADGDPTAADVAQSLNAGLGFANYTGHGSDTAWVSSGFSITDINGLTNNNKLPFIYDVACVNGNFVGQECFGEAWLRATNNGEPTGAVAIAASTINQSWAPPMVAQDEMTDILVGIAASGTKRTYAGIFVNGMFQMGDETSDWPMLDTWTCFGDPSLYVRTDNTSNMVISHNDVVIVGESTFSVNCDLDGAIATLSNNGVIIGSSVVNSGNASIPVSDVIPGTELTLAVVGFNKVTYLTSINVIAPDGTYLVVEDYVNSLAFGSTADLDIQIGNVGVDDATSVNVVATTTDSHATLTNNTYAYGTINADGSATSAGAFTLSVDNDLEDQYTVEIAIEITDDSDTWNETKFVTVNAPILEVGSSIVVDDSSGNDDGILDPGETADIHIISGNIGHASIANVIGAITSGSEALTINTTTTSPTSLNVDTDDEFIFSITAGDDVADGTVATINYTVTGGTDNQYSALDSFDIIIGFVPEYCTPTHETTTDEFIQQVIFNTIDNTSEQGPDYTDFTEISTNINREGSYPITIVNGEHFSSDAMGCWFDWNYDGDFDDAGESYTIDYSSDSGETGTGTGNILVPEDAHLGATRMRVRVVYATEALPCGDASYGEAEDYTVIVGEALGDTDFDISQISLYPNPSNGTFNIDLSALNTDEAVSVSIFNTNGQLVYHTTSSDNKMTIDIHEATGVYFLRVSSGNQVANKKLIIK